MRTIRRQWPVLALVCALSACGSGDDDATAASSVAAPSPAADVTTTVTTNPTPTTAASTVPATTPTSVAATTAAPVVVVATPSTTSGSVEPVDVGLVLRPDGLGLVTFDMNLADTLAALEGVLGPPDFLGEARFEPAIGSMQSVTWGSLTVHFTGGASQMYFTAYDFSRPYDARPDETGEYRMVLTDWEPSGWELGLATDDGIGLGTPEEDAAAAYPDVYAAECDGSTTPTSLLTGDESMWQMFVEPQQSGLYLQRPLDGVVWWIGAQVARNPMACDGT